jgi:hypothetical protein
MRGGSFTLLPATVITGAVTGSVGPTIPCKGLRDLLVEASFAYGSGGTTAKFWIQTRTDGGTWRDVMNFAFTTATLTKFQKVSIGIALAANTASSDAALADNTITDGLLGDEVRVKYTTTGTYAGDTSITVRASARY